MQQMGMNLIRTQCCCFFRNVIHQYHLQSYIHHLSPTCKMCWNIWNIVKTIKIAINNIESNLYEIFTSSGPLQMNNASKLQQLLHDCFGHIGLTSDLHEQSQDNRELKNRPGVGIIYVSLWQLESIKKFNPHQRHGFWMRKSVHLQ